MYVDSYAKTFLIVYPPFENSTTRVAIATVPGVNMYVIRCNMMAVIIRVFYDHGMNFPLKAPTRAYYLVTRYHVNGKATRLYKARYLDDG